MKGFERKQRVSNRRKMGLAGTAATAAVGSTVATAEAEFIVSPTSVVSNSMGESTSSRDIGNVIDQSGLSGGFVSGTTDYSDYLLTSPTHSTSKLGVSWLSNSAPPGNIVFDLGAEFTIERLAIWQGGPTFKASTLAVNGITLETSRDLAFTIPNAAGSFNVPSQDVGASSHPVNDFDLTDSVGRYVRLTINSNYGAPGNVSFGEIAFDVSSTPVPEPSSIFIVAVAGLSLFAGRLRRRLA